MGVLKRILGFLEEFEVGLLLEAPRVLRRRVCGVGGVEGGCGMGLLLFFIVRGSFRDCIKVAVVLSIRIWER